MGALRCSSPLAVLLLRAFPALWLSLLALQLGAMNAAAQYVVQGRKIDWHMTAVEGWVGGSYEQIDQVAQTTSSERIRKLMRAMLQEATHLDAYLVNLDVDGLRTGTMTSLNVNVGGAFSEAALEGVWPEYATMVAGEQGPGSTAKVLSSVSIAVGGKESREGVLQVTRAGGAKVYYAVCIVMLDTKRSHLFRMRADETKFEAAYRGYRQMLQSLRYE